jgi:hypothetical protein
MRQGRGRKSFDLPRVERGGGRGVIGAVYAEGFDDTKAKIT